MVQQRGEGVDVVALEGVDVGRERGALGGGQRRAGLAEVAGGEGRPDVAGLFKDTADGETGHAHGHLDYLKAAVAGETHEYETMYPGMAKDAREEGFHDIAEWFETLAKAEKSHAGRFKKALDSLDF